jgi:hypothetical protein
MVTNFGLSHKQHILYSTRTLELMAPDSNASVQPSLKSIVTRKAPTR